MKTKFFLFLLLIAATHMKANNMLVKNVTTTGDNAANKTIQVQFDMSWDNSWRDAINWDAAWVFMKFKDASGNWQHVLLNTTGFANGTGTENTIQVGSDKVGAFVYRSATGTGTFASTTMQLQWNYGLSGLTNVTGLEVRVFAVEMVYVPQGDFNCAKQFRTQRGFQNLRSLTAPGNNFPVINNRLTPVISYNDGTSLTLRIKGDAGIDTDINGTVDNTTYPTGYKAFYCYKYELTEQQYADFLNTLTATQITTLGVAGSSITLTNGEYFSSTPIRACNSSDSNRVLSYADWSGLRVMTILEFNKASYGPIQPEYNNQCCPNTDGYPAWGSSSGVPSWSPGGSTNYLANVGSFATASSDRISSGASFYGIMDLTGNAVEPVIKLSYYNYSSQNGNGVLDVNGNTDFSNWNLTNMLIFIDQTNAGNYMKGFRYARSAE